MPRGKRMTIAQFTERYPDVEHMDAFWWCESPVAEFNDYGFYCCIVLAKAPDGRVVTEEFRAENEVSLAARLAESNVEPPPYEVIRERCRSAPHGIPALRRRGGAR
jgi:hypothetical protein